MNPYPMEVSSPVVHIQEAVTALCSGDIEAAQTALLAIDLTDLMHYRQARLAAVSSLAIPTPAPTPGPPRTRRSIERKKLATFARDHWICRFCGTRTVDLRVLKQLSTMFSTDFPYHSNWKFGHSHLIYWTHSTSLEHLVPFARGGTDDPTNFVTTCYACNDSRCHFLVEELGWTLHGTEDSDWRGLTEYLPQLRQLSVPNS